MVNRRSGRVLQLQEEAQTFLDAVMQAKGGQSAFSRDRTFLRAASIWVSVGRNGAAGEAQRERSEAESRSACSE
jgi:hypothetical protein